MIFSTFTIGRLTVISNVLIINPRCSMTCDGSAEDFTSLTVNPKLFSRVLARIVCDTNN